MDMEKEEEKKTICLDCGTEFAGKFCPNCGQKATTRRLKFKEIVGDTYSSIAGGDNKFVNTCRDLCYRPGHLVREYLQGRRTRYTKPLQALVLSITIYAVLSFIIGKDPFDFYEMTTSNVKMEAVDEDTDELVTFVKKIYHFFADNKLYYTIVSAIISIIPYRFVFRKYKIKRPGSEAMPLNCTEQFYTQLYLSSISMMFAVLLLPFSLIHGSDEIIKNINTLAEVIIAIVLFKQLYGIGWWKSIKCNIKAFILILINIVIAVIIAALVIGAAYIVIYGLDDIAGKSNA